jgi:hypothetical protein
MNSKRYLKNDAEGEDRSGACRGSPALEPRDFTAFERATSGRDLPSFPEAVQVVNWENRPAADLAKAIQYSLSLGHFAVAQQLAQVGERPHGDDP